MDKSREKIVEKIRRLLALADDQKGLPEGEAAAKVALQIMKIHAIDMAQLSVEERQEVDALVKETCDLGSQSFWRRSLANSLAEYCNCKAVYITGSSVVSFFGHQSDIVLLRYLYDVCEGQISRDASAFYQQHLKGEHLARSRRNDFCHSAVIGLRDKLRRMRNDESHESHGMALVLNRKENVEDFYRRVMKEQVRQHRQDFGWESNGYDAGSRINIGKGGLTPAPKKKTRGHLK